MAVTPESSPVHTNGDLKEFVERLSSLRDDVRRVVHAVTTRPERERIIAEFDQRQQELRRLASRGVAGQVADVVGERPVQWFADTLGIVRDLCGEVSRIVRAERLVNQPPDQADTPPQWGNIERLQELLTDLNQRANLLHDALPFATPSAEAERQTTFKLDETTGELVLPPGTPDSYERLAGCTPLTFDQIVEAVRELVGRIRRFGDSPYLWKWLHETWGRSVGGTWPVDDLLVNRVTRYVQQNVTDQQLRLAYHSLINVVRHTEGDNVADRLDNFLKEITRLEQQGTTQQPGESATITLPEANIAATQLAEDDDNFINLTAREWAAAIKNHTGKNCSLGLIPELPFWKAVMEKTGRGKASKGLKTVTLSERLEEKIGEGGRDATLNKLISEQEADFEPSPLRDDVVGERRKVRSNRKL